jgi:hypothetical protein
MGRDDKDGHGHQVASHRGLSPMTPHSAPMPLPPLARPPLLSIPANDAHRMTWCGTQKQRRTPREARPDARVTASTTDIAQTGHSPSLSRPLASGRPSASPISTNHLRFSFPIVPRFSPCPAPNPHPSAQRLPERRWSAASPENKLRETSRISPPTAGRRSNHTQGPCHGQTQHRGGSVLLTLTAFLQCATLVVQSRIFWYSFSAASIHWHRDPVTVI